MGPCSSIITKPQNVATELPDHVVNPDIVGLDLHESGFHRASSLVGYVEILAWRRRRHQIREVVRLVSIVAIIMIIVLLTSLLQCALSTNVAILIHTNNSTILLHLCVITRVSE